MRSRRCFAPAVFASKTRRTSDCCHKMISLGLAIATAPQAQFSVLSRKKTVMPTATMLGTKLDAPAKAAHPPTSATHTPPNEKIASKAAPPPTSPTRKPHTLPRLGRRRRALGRRGRAPHRLKHTAWMPSGPGDSSQLLPSGRHGCGLVIVYWCVLSSLVAIEDKRSLSDHFPGNTSNIYG